MDDLLKSILDDPALGPMVAHHRRLPGRPARHADPADPLGPELSAALESLGISALYSHQAEALDAAREGAHVLAATPTASGKTLLFALPVMESLLRDPGARALFVYPTKALAQDQITGLRELARLARPLRPPRVEIYDGDTPPHQRRRIKADPPEILITNPDMLHMGILAYHGSWSGWLAGLRWVVLDEMHVYRGVFGAHVHHILWRLRRLARRAGGRLQFLGASATIGNPDAFAETLAGVPFHVVSDSGAPQAPRRVLMIQPSGVSPYTAAVRLVARSASRRLRTIAFTKARRITELLHTWLVQQHPELAPRVAPYRAGYLPEERRAIEARLFRGDLLAVLSTSALELGIDVGGLDVCVLVGYPGSRMSTWQRIGRAGRGDREALAAWVAMPDSLDQYLLAHPEQFFDGGFEPAILDPANSAVAGPHLVCAAAEAPLEAEEVGERGPVRSLVDALAAEGKLAQAASGSRWHAYRRRPQRDVHPRTAGQPFAIVEAGSGRMLGSIDSMRVYHECHPGAIYLHGGQTYHVLELDADKRQVTAEPVQVDYYTVVLGEKETEILERHEEGSVGRHPAGFGRLKVTVRIRGYQKKRLWTGETFAEHPLDCPPLVYETTGLWVRIPTGLDAHLTQEGLHFMGGIHAVEHAAIGLFPLLAIADRGDIGGISYTFHPQLEGPGFFIYDGVPGGAGLAAHAYRGLATLLERTREHVAACPCEEGCPACIQSPKCGNGNRPLDKAACLTILEVLLGRELEGVTDAPAPLPVGQAPEDAVAPAVAAPSRRHGITRAVPAARDAGPPPVPDPRPKEARGNGGETVLVFDLETQRSAEEVGGWDRADRMGLALAVVCDLGRGVYRTYFEADVEKLLLDLVTADRVIGFNIKRFDLKVLSGYSRWPLEKIRAVDLLEEIRAHLGFRVSLNHLAEANLGEAKAGDGLQSLRWWREGRLDLVEQYCRKDVEVTRRLYELGRRQGYLVYESKGGERLRVPVRW